MRAGLLTEQIQIFTPQLTKDSFGEETESWVFKYDTRARLIHNNGSRRNTNDEIFYSYNKTFQVRYYVPVDNFDRIKWNGKMYRILDIEPNKEQMMINITTELIND